jgi:N-acetylglucosamine-6-phosphate deacetylase
MNSIFKGVDAMRLTLRGVHLVDATQELSDCDIAIDGERIGAVGGTLADAGRVVEAKDMLVVPGFIDVHTHGGGGFNLHTTRAEEIRSYTSWAPRTGVTSFLIGVVGVPGALPEEQLVTAVEAIESKCGGAEALGIHLEGPYINVKRRGAHLPEWLRQPNEAETERVLKLTGGHLLLITLAPELPGAAQMIRRLLDAGVTVSIGHTDATYEQAMEAIRLGATHATHCFNAMPPLLHRAPGPIAAIAESPQVRGELIADGVHVRPPVMYALVRMLGAQRTVVITDALAAAGLPDDATFEFAGQLAQVICGAARLADGRLTGSVLTMEQALRNMLEWTPVTLQEAVTMLTLNPARAVKVDGRKGRLQPGYDADLLILNSSLELQATICRGTLAYVTEEWQARLSEA